MNLKWDNWGKSSKWHHNFIINVWWRKWEFITCFTDKWIDNNEEHKEICKKTWSFTNELKVCLCPKRHLGMIVALNKSKEHMSGVGVCDTFAGDRRLSCWKTKFLLDRSFNYLTIRGKLSPYWWKLLFHICIPCIPTSSGLKIKVWKWEENLSS